jgi:ABC-type transport system involved in cytochrome c biogenesis permease component
VLGAFIGAVVMALFWGGFEGGILVALFLFPMQ